LQVLFKELLGFVYHGPSHYFSTSCLSG
jgi:hypothetical protein